ncbi:MAG: DUF255 domain-containing protein [Bacillota bacterium]
MDEDFRFSPRPNRAHEIQWRNWGRAPFDEAQRAQKPVLLAISGVWCHWCHVMDETTYSDPDVIGLINEYYIPVRVDSDRRPDVNSRYNLGGWPTTAILTPGGELLTGGTYVPPDQLKRLLRGMAKVFSEEHEGIVKRLARASLERHEEREEPDEALERPDDREARKCYALVLQALRRAYDQVHGGFGREPKFPMVDALELALKEYVITGDESLREMVLQSLSGMAGGGMYDHVEGGFFRYSTTRDWSIPHFEKMLEDNAGLLRLLGEVHAVTGDSRWSDLAQDVYRFLKNVMFLPDTGCWAGTQDADEEYYGLPETRRRQREAPYVDRTIYTNYNAMMARALMESGAYLGQDEWISAGERTLEVLWNMAYRTGYGVAHYVLDGEPRLFGLLEDNVMVGRAALAAHAVTGGARWLDMSRELADFTVARFSAAAGGLRAHLVDGDAVGPLARPRVELDSNSVAMAWLAALGRTTGSTEYLDQVARSVTAPHTGHAQDRVTSAAYALAISAWQRPWVTVVLSGTSGAQDAMRGAALGVYLPQKALVTGEAGHRVLVCVGTRCLKPVASAQALAEELRELSTPGKNRELLDQWGEALLVEDACTNRERELGHRSLS